jgi:hypothetical protein
LEIKATFSTEKLFSLPRRVEGSKKEGDSQKNTIVQWLSNAYQSLLKKKPGISANDEVLVTTWIFQV